jgi:hypothetical protein
MSIAKLLAGVAALALAACTPARDPAPENRAETSNAAEIVVPTPKPAASANASEEAAGLQVDLAPDELTLVAPGGSAQHVTFGTGTAKAIELVAKALGEPIEQATNQDCGSGPLGYATYRDGLSLYFEGGKFAGWDLDGRENGKFATAAGIGIGTSRKALDAAGPVQVEESTIGHEFMLGELSGLLSSTGAEGKVTNLWAGVTCIAR